MDNETVEELLYLAAKARADVVSVLRVLDEVARAAGVSLPGGQDVYDLFEKERLVALREALQRADGALASRLYAELEGPGG